MRLWNLVLAAIVAATLPASAQTVPQFQVDTSWPKPLPNNWAIGGITGMFVDHEDHIWVLNRPRDLDDALLTEDDGGYRVPGGADFAVLDCLNAGEAGMAMIEALVRRELDGWLKQK